MPRCRARSSPWPQDLTQHRQSPSTALCNARPSTATDVLAITRRANVQRWANTVSSVGTKATSPLVDTSTDQGPTRGRTNSKTTARDTRVDPKRPEVTANMRDLARRGSFRTRPDVSATSVAAPPPETCNQIAPSFARARTILSTFYHTFIV